MNAGEALVPVDRRPAIRKFSFGHGLKALEGFNHVLSPVEDETRLVTALEELPSRFDESKPFGVFVFSDGRSTDPNAAGTAAAATGDLGVPIHVVPVGDARISGDVAVQDIDAPRDARPGTRVPIRVTLAQPRLRRRAHRVSDPRGRRPQGRCAGDPAGHAR